MMTKSIVFSWTFWAYIITVLISYTITNKFWLSIGIGLISFTTTAILENWKLIKTGVKNAQNTG